MLEGKVIESVRDGPSGEEDVRQDKQKSCIDRHV